jgi:hypothetical protein
LDGFIWWSHLVLNGVGVVGLVQGLINRFRQIPADQQFDRLIDGAKFSFFIFAVVGFAVLIYTSPPAPPAEPIHCIGLTVGRIDASGKLIGDMTPGKWQYNSDNGVITGANGKRYEGGYILPDDWCMVRPRS